jgi:hypothetical protein
MITEYYSWSLGSCPNKSLDWVEFPVCPHQADHFSECGVLCAKRTECSPVPTDTALAWRIPRLRRHAYDKRFSALATDSLRPPVSQINRPRTGYGPVNDRIRSDTVRIILPAFSKLNISGSVAYRGQTNSSAQISWIARHRSADSPVRRLPVPVPHFLGDEPRVSTRMLR